jgi:hypothetical protein
MKKETETVTGDQKPDSTISPNTVTDLKNSNRPFHKECGDCFYNDGSCTDDYRICCYLIKGQDSKQVSKDHQSSKNQ